MALVCLIVGLILLFVGAHWFAGAATVGAILLIVGAVLFIAPLLGAASAAEWLRRRP